MLGALHQHLLGEEVHQVQVEVPLGQDWWAGAPPSGGPAHLHLALHLAPHHPLPPPAPLHSTPHPAGGPGEAQKYCPRCSFYPTNFYLHDDGVQSIWNIIILFAEVCCKCRRFSFSATHPRQCRVGIKHQKTSCCPFEASKDALNNYNMLQS